MVLLPLHSTTHWYVVRSWPTVRHTVRTDVWRLPSDWRAAWSLRSSARNGDSAWDWADETGPTSEPFVTLNHVTFSSRCPAPLMVHFSSVGTRAYTTLGWMISETLGRTVKREMNSYHHTDMILWPLLHITCIRCKQVHCYTIEATFFFTITNNFSCRPMPSAFIHTAK